MKGTGTTGHDEYEYYAMEYINEIVPSIHDMEQLVLSITDASKRPQSIKHLTRLVHTIKGSAGGFGFDLISSICHSFEDQLTAMRINAEEIDNQISDFLIYIDLLRAAQKAYVQNDPMALNVIQKKMRGAEQSAAAEARSETSFQRPRLLIVEKTFTLLRSYSRVVTSLEADIEVATAKNGFEGLGRLLEGRFDCVLMSNLVDLISGAELLGILSQIPSPNPKTPFILMTSSSHLEVGVVSNPYHIIQKSDDFLNVLSGRLKGLLATQQLKDSTAAKSPYKRILLIDDSKDIHLLAEMAFKKIKDVQFKALFSGIKAIEEIEKFRPELVLLDYQMPDIDGVQIARQLRAKFPKLPYVFLTGTADSNDHALLMKEGPMAIFRKPFAPKELPRFISKMASS